MKYKNLIITRQDDGRYSFVFNGNFADFKIWREDELIELKEAIEQLDLEGK